MQGTVASFKPRSRIGFNPLLPEFRENPYPFLRQLREQEPVHWNPVFSNWVLTRYSDVVAVLRDNRLSADPRNWENYAKHQLRAGSADIAGRAQVLRRFMLQTDPPDHTRLRSLVSKAFTPKAIDAMRPEVEWIVNQLLDRVISTGQMEVIGDLAYPLAVGVISRMLGVPTELDAQVGQWADAIVPTVGPVVSAQQLVAGTRAMEEFGDAIRQIIDHRRSAPQDHLIDALIAARDGGNKLSDDELVATCILLVTAGHITTVQLVAKGLRLLLTHPDQMRLLQDQPALLGGAVEEMLRHDGSVQMLNRVAKEDVEIGGQRIAKGQMVLISIVAANRDPQQFPDPDRFDITRSPNRHLAFGYGDHFCAGAPLARLEAKTTIDIMLRRLPNLRLTGEPLQHDRNFLLRGLTALPVLFDRGGAA